MTDIVERLRAYAEINEHTGAYTEANCAFDAIAEIERLRKEIERLREVLEIISKPTYGTELYDTAYQRAEMYWQHLKRFQAIAKKALEK